MKCVRVLAALVLLVCVGVHARRSGNLLLRRQREAAMLGERAAVSKIHFDELDTAYKAVVAGGPADPKKFAKLIFELMAGKVKSTVEKEDYVRKKQKPSKQSFELTAYTAAEADLIVNCIKKFEDAELLTLLDTLDQQGDEYSYMVDTFRLVYVHLPTVGDDLAKTRVTSLLDHFKNKMNVQKCQRPLADFDDTVMAYKATFWKANEFIPGMATLLGAVAHGDSDVDGPLDADRGAIVSGRIEGMAHTTIWQQMYARGKATNKKVHLSYLHGSLSDYLSFKAGTVATSFAGVLHWAGVTDAPTPTQTSETSIAKAKLANIRAYIKLRPKCNYVFFGDLHESDYRVAMNLTTTPDDHTAFAVIFDDFENQAASLGLKGSANIKLCKTALCAAKALKASGNVLFTDKSVKAVATVLRERIAQYDKANSWKNDTVKDAAKAVIAQDMNGVDLPDVVPGGPGAGGGGGGDGGAPAAQRLLLSHIFWMTASMPKKGVLDPFYGTVHFPRSAKGDVNRYELVGYFQSAEEASDTSDHVRCVMLRRVGTNQIFAAIRGALRLSTTPEGVTTLSPFSKHNQVAWQISSTMLEAGTLQEVGSTGTSCNDKPCLHSGAKGYTDRLMQLKNKVANSPLEAIKGSTFHDAMVTLLKDKNVQVTLTGLSLGGAMSALTHYKLHEELKNDDKYDKKRFRTYAFGPMRVGNKAVADVLKDLPIIFYTTCDQEARICSTFVGKKFNSGIKPADRIGDVQKVGVSTEPERKGSRLACENLCQRTPTCMMFTVDETAGECTLYKSSINPATHPPAPEKRFSVGYCQTAKHKCDTQAPGKLKLTQDDVIATIAEERKASTKKDELAEESKDCENHCEMHTGCKAYSFDHAKHECTLFKKSFASTDVEVAEGFVHAKCETALNKRADNTKGNTGIYDILPFYPDHNTTDPSFVPNPNQHVLCKVGCPALVPQSQCSSRLAMDITKHPTKNKYGVIGGVLVSKSLEHTVTDTTCSDDVLNTMGEFGFWHSGSTYLTQTEFVDEHKPLGGTNYCDLPNEIAMPPIP